MLNIRHERFVDEYLVDYNATAAYQRAFKRGRKVPKGAGQSAHTLLKRPEIQAAIQVRRAELYSAAGVTPDYIRARLVENLERSLRRGDGSVANRSAELLGKDKGMFVDRTLTTNVSLEELLAGSRASVAPPIHVPGNGNGKHPTPAGR